MKFNKSLLILGCCFLCIALFAQAQNLDDGTESNNNNNGRSASLGLFDLVMSPIRATIAQARRILSPSREGSNGRMDSIRLQTYKIFMRLYNKTYSPEELPRRMALFFQRREDIVESQKMFEKGLSMFAMRENEFTDWDDNELRKLTGVSLPSASELTPEETIESEEKEPLVTSSINITSTDLDDESENMIVKADTPATKDWRKSGCVSTPINQYKCGACYAIATMSVVESMRCLNHVSSPTLSPQQIVDCATVRAGYQNYGCDGGWPTRVLKYLQDTGVATREKCYPFVQRQNTCKLRQVKATSGCAVSASFKGKTIQYKVLRNERDVLHHVANTGPVVTVMKASDKFLYYGKGIFDDARCSRKRDDVDHAIVIVGYGTENNTDYWIIKNSWGTTEWGMGGYGLYRRGKNACSIGHWGWVVTG